LRQLIERTRERFGYCILLDCHSMPSVGGPLDRDHGQSRVDFVLGDRFGSACAPALVDLVERTLEGMGYAVARNSPYAGGYTTEFYGRPAEGLHALQIEINRALYLNERSLSRHGGFDRLARNLELLVDQLAAADWGGLIGPPIP
jgi:N-formylglutamate amidohydrolase